MPDNPINPPIDPQTPPGEHRVVWRDGTPLMAEDMRRCRPSLPRASRSCQMHVGTCRTGGFAPCPTGRTNINDPVQQHLVLVTVLAGNTLEAIDKLRDINDHIEATRILVKDGVNQPDREAPRRPSRHGQGRHKDARPMSATRDPAWEALRIQAKSADIVEIARQMGARLKAKQPLPRRRLPAWLRHRSTASSSIRARSSFFCRPTGGKEGAATSSP